MNSQMVTKFILKGEFLFAEVLDLDVEGVVIDLDVKTGTDNESVSPLVVRIGELPGSHVEQWRIILGGWFCFP